MLKLDKNPMETSRRNKYILSIALIIVLGLIAYSNSLNGSFIWDDELLIKDNAYIKNWSNVAKVFTKSMGSGVGIPERYSFYRPMQMLTYMLDYSLWRLNVIGYHLTNILLHILVALSIYWFVNMLFDNNILSLLTSFFFVVHPIHTEAVSYISGRSDSLGAIFILLCFIFYIKQLYSNNTKLYILMLISYILALLSRESSLILPLLLLLYHYTFKKKIKVKETLPILIITFTYILLRVTVLRSLLSNDISNNTTFFQRLPGFFVAITNYIRLLLLPFHLHMEYGKKLFKFTDPKSILGIVILFSSLIYAFRQKNRNRLIFFSVFWFFIALLAFSNIYPLNAYMAEHWLYLPSIGFFLIMAKGLSSLYRRRKYQIFATALIISLIAFYSYLTIKQNRYWKDSITFYERTLKYAPHSAEVYYNLGRAYYTIGRRREAIASFKKAIEINPNDPEAYYNLGIVYSAIGKYEEAITSYKKAIELNPSDAMAYKNLAVLYYGKKQYDLAITYCDKAIGLGYKVDPEFLKLLEPFRWD